MSAKPTGGTTELGANGEQGNESEEPKLTAQDVAQMVNQAITEREKRSQPKLMAELTKALSSELSGSLKTLFEEHVKATVAPGTPEKPGELDAKDKELADLRKQMSESKKQMDTIIAKAKEDELRAQEVSKKARETNALATMKAELGPKVRPEQLDALIDSLYLRQVKFDDDGNAVMTVKNAATRFAAESIEEVPLKDGIVRFLASKDAEVWLPPKVTKPTQATPQRNAAGQQVSHGGSTKPITQETDLNVLMAHYQINDQVAE